MRKKAVILCLIIALVAGGLYIYSNQKPKKDENTLVVGIDEVGFPPMAFVNAKKEVCGFDVDLLYEIGKRTKLKVVFKPINWGDIQKVLDKGTVDCVASGLGITHERKKTMLFSRPYMRSRHRVFVPAQTTVRKLSELKGWQIGIMGNTTTEELSNEDPAFHTGMRVKKFSSYRAALDDMMGGNGVVAVLAPEITGLYYIKNINDFCMPLEGQYGDTSFVALAYQKDNIALFNKLQAALDEIMEDGTGRKISMKWFGKDLTIYDK